VLPPLFPPRLLIAAVLLSLVTGLTRADEPPGAIIYRDRCASCHGPAGEGVADEYASPLTGDRSLKELSQYIDEKMPKDEADSLSAADSVTVAAYVHDAFYSPTAQFRNKPARVELSRLTVRQYRHAVSDIVASFVGRGDFGNERGLHGEYFASRRPRDNRRIIERIDPVVLFDFKGGTPEHEMIPNAEEYSADWEGAVIAPDDGTYEFIVDTENATRLFINNRESPLIDASVKSGDQREFRESIHLLGGYPYRLRLELIKSKPEKTCSIKLKWKRPGHADELVPNRFLWPQQPPERLVLTTPFPPDDRSMGYERGSSVSKEWDEAATYAAVEAADWITARRHRLAGTESDAGDRVDKLKQFSKRFVELAFRRPLTDEQRAAYVDRQFESSPDDETAVKRIVLLTLKSPRFLYRELADDSADQYAVASRISFSLWDSIPDEPLLQAAASGQLASRDQVQSHVDRTLDDHRTRSKLGEFFRQWLRIDHFGDLAKDAEAYPEFTPELIADLRSSLELFIDDVVWSDASDYRRLMTSNEIFVNGRLAKFYGLDLPERADFQKLSVESQQRAGILSHPYLLAGFAYRSASSPIHRGVFITRSLLGRVLRPPPEAVAPLAPDLHQGLTTRERVNLQTSPETCQSCHSMINSLGFSLEHFDAVGRYRQEEKSKGIDSAGAYVTKAGDSETFANGQELAAFLARSPESAEAFASQLFHFVVKQPVRAYGLDRPDRLRDKFAENAYSIRRLLAEIVTTAAFEAPAATAPVAQSAGG
jgi:hypothetical protein